MASPAKSVDPPPNTVYKTFILVGERFTLGDTILVKQDKGVKDFVGKIEKIYTDKQGEVNLDVSWYYRPEETKIGKQPYHAMNELMASNHKGTFHVGCVNSKCIIHSLEKYEELNMSGQTKQPGGLPEFMTRSFYDYKKGKLRVSSIKVMTLVPLTTHTHNFSLCFFLSFSPQPICV
eukprot:m.15814 g.15814  ORF g.15814 m.15814 type:complete len:177 (-) comp5494_c0_seq2:1551-2081(-)